MQKEEGIFFVLVTLLLAICYFSPLTKQDVDIESFEDIPTSDEEKYPVETVKVPVNQTIYGPKRSLNLTGVQGSFPYLEDSPLIDGKVKLLKEDGTIIGGYRHQIIRPFDTLKAQNNPDKCSWPCYSDLKHQTWCSEKNAIEYHAMRPLVSPSQYDKNLKKMFKLIIDYKHVIQENDKTYESVFCTETPKQISSWLLTKINAAVAKMPEMQRNGPWKYEYFRIIDTQLYQLKENGSVYFKMVFNLFNPLRSVATLCACTIVMKNKKLFLTEIDFVNDGQMTDYIPAMGNLGPINGQNVSRNAKQGHGIEQFVPLGYDNSPEGYSLYKHDWMKNPNEFDWNYKNTLPVQKFNKYGFYSNNPSQNIEIKGSYPKSLQGAMNHCSDSMLMECSVPKYTGTNGKKILGPDSTGHNVNNNPTITYSIDPLSINSNVKPSGKFYV